MEFLKFMITLIILENLGKNAENKTKVNII